MELRSDTSHALQLPSDPQSACSSLLVSRKNQVDLIDQDLTENGRIITLKVIWVCKSYPSEFWRDHIILSSKNEVIKFSLGRGEWWADVIDSVHESRFSCCGWWLRTTTRYSLHEKRQPLLQTREEISTNNTIFFLFCAQVFMGWDLLSPWLLNNLYIKNNINNISSIFIYKIEDFLYGNATVP